MRKKASKFRGVARRPNGRWSAVITVAGQAYALAAVEDEREAAGFYDRMARHYHGPSAVLNFPRRRLRPASFEDLRDLLFARRKQTTESRYRGVTRNGDRCWGAYVRVGTRVWSVGKYQSERAAARARDRAALHFFGSEARLNFPNADLSPASPLELRAELRANAKVRSSRFRGVSRGGDGRWIAEIAGRFIGSYEDEQAAAEDYDRAALHVFGREAPRNFPTRKLGSRSVEHIRTRNRALQKKRCWSRYHGVTPSAAPGKWTAQSRGTHLGNYANEQDAARAYDRYMLGTEGPQFRYFNFPEEVRTAALRPASAKALRVERWAAFKGTTSSRYTGVSWNIGKQRWEANITVDRARHRLGYFDSEHEAARAYDRAAIRLGGHRTVRRNFS